MSNSNIKTIMNSLNARNYFCSIYPASINDVYTIHVEKNGFARDYRYCSNHDPINFVNDIVKDYNTELYTSKKDALNSIHHELIAIQNKLAEKGYISTMSHIESGEYEVRITTNDYKVKYLYNIGDGDIKFVNMVIRNYKAHLKTIPEIVNVIFNEPATIVLWSDGSKTVVKADGELFDPEKGLAMAIVKKMYGNKGNYFNNIKKWTDTYNRDGNAMSPMGDTNIN